MILSALRRSIGSNPCLGALTVFAATLAFSSLFASAASAEEKPAVKESNLRIIADYAYRHINSDEVFRFGPTVLTNTPELNVDDGGFRGIYTFPILDDAALGARLIGGANFSKVDGDFDSLAVPVVVADPAVKRHGLDLGGEVFWRDPSVGELGMGTFYIFAEADSGSDTRSEHTAGVTAFGKIFVNDFMGYGPVDLDGSVEFSDSNIDDNGALSAQRPQPTGWPRPLAGAAARAATLRAWWPPASR